MRLIDRIMLGLAYVGLVAVVMGGGVWIKGELDDAHAERCDLGRLQLRLVDLEYEAADLPPPAVLADMRSRLEQECAP